MEDIAGAISGLADSMPCSHPEDYAGIIGAITDVGDSINDLAKDVPRLLDEINETLMKMAAQRDVDTKELHGLLKRIGDGLEGPAKRRKESS